MQLQAAIRDTLTIEPPVTTGEEDASRRALAVLEHPDNVEPWAGPARADRGGLLRQLIERQALRRVEAGNLTDEQVECLGTTLMLLEQRVAELTQHLGLDEST